MIGSLSFAVIVSTVLGLPDPHTYGSGNPGASNVLRSGSKKAAVLTLVGDAGKGWVAVMFALMFADRFGVNASGIALVAVAVFLGHLYPLYFGFKGGKGVATAAGILIALNPWLGLASLATWLIIAGFFRYSSLAALVTAVFAPAYGFFLFGAHPYVGASLVMAVFLIIRHRDNIARLRNGRETRIGDKKTSAA